MQLQNSNTIKQKTSHENHEHEQIQGQEHEINKQNGELK